METTQLTSYRREVLRRIAEFTWKDCLPDRIYELLYKFIREDGPRVRCCVHKERAVIKNRIQVALWQPTRLNIINAARATLDGDIDWSLPVLDVLPDACDACPIDKYYVTDVCRHCVQHKCIDRCPKKAISIQNGRAFIDRDECIECGLCMKGCPFKAIVEVIRPCIQACGVKAISVGTDKRVAINAESCVTCGNCRGACPFGAIDERSMIVPLLMALKGGKKVAAMLAPSFVGQFGMKVSAGQVAAALKKLGFSRVVAVAEGADMTAIHEAAELKEKVPAKLAFLTSSCCPSFVNLVNKHFPEFSDNVSRTVSPMISIARWLKHEDKDIVTCFIGPCISKKEEAIKNRDSVDFVLTYEELQCVFEGTGIMPGSMENDDLETTASVSGTGFPLENGVQEAIRLLRNKFDSGREPVMEYASGTRDCFAKLQAVKDGKITPGYIEGMACEAGCLGGPGTLSAAGVTRVLLTRQLATADTISSRENPKAVAANGVLDLEVKK